MIYIFFFSSLPSISNAFYTPNNNTTSLTLEQRTRFCSPTLATCFVLDTDFHWQLPVRENHSAEFMLYSRCQVSSCSRYLLWIFHGWISLRKLELKSEIFSYSQSC